MSDYIEIDYNHPCWIHNVYIIGVFFVLCYLSLGINLVCIIISIIRMNKYINQYKEDKIGLLFRRRLTKFLIWTIFCILVFIHKFSMFFYEFHNNVMRNFYEILLKSVIESTNGPLYVIISLKGINCHIYKFEQYIIDNIILIYMFIFNMFNITAITYR